MLSFDARAASRQELYRDLVYGTAELVSRSLPIGELLENAVALGKAFFKASSMQIHLRDDVPACDGDRTPASVSQNVSDEAAWEAIRNGTTRCAPGAMSMAVPICFGAEVRGAISLVRTSGPAFDELDASLCEKWALLLGVRIHELHLSAANARLEVLVGIDGLTGIYNRRAFSELLAAAWMRSAASGTSLAIAMIDVDFFKSFNDKYGHVAGDTALKQIAQTIALSLRSGDVLGRYGGEEFAIFFEAESLGSAIEVAERVRENILALGTPHLGSRLGTMTASVGVAAIIPRAECDPSSLLERADGALYDAKAGGRNRVVAETYVSESAEALAQHDARHNLPTPTSSFCARHDDAQKLRAALAQTRLVTIVGFGGVGKTRLALEIASELYESCRDGVWFVDLAGTTDPDVIPAMVAALLDVCDPAVSDSAEALAERCRHKAALIVLDNCEHLKRACATFAATLLKTAPQLRILATSREPLDAPGERVVLLRPFGLPEGDTLTAEEALRFPAIRLFVDRARAVTHFELRDETVDAVVELCRRVDGIALGIELAAARLKMLGLEELRSKLDQRFALLGRGGPAVAARQQTLRALIDWSFELLSNDERIVFRRLGIFAGSFTFEAAAAVCDDDGAGPDVLDALGALVDKSLLVIEARGEDQHTFRFFGSIRSYARDRLCAAGEFDPIELRYCTYFLDVATAADAVAATPEWRTALRPLEFAANDVRAVLESTLASGRDRIYGADLAAKLIDYWLLHELRREGRAWLECALRSCDPTFSHDLHARVRLGLLDFYAMGEARAALVLATEALAAARAGGDPRWEAKAAFHLANVHVNLGDLELAQTYLDDAQRHSERSGDLVTLARASNSRGMCAALCGDEAGAAEFVSCAEQLFYRLNRGERAVMPLGNLAELDGCHGRFERAIDVAKRALAIAERSGDRSASAWLLGNLGAYYLGLEDHDSAASFTRDGLRIAYEIEDVWEVLYCTDTYARISFAEGDDDLAALFLGYAEKRLSALCVPRQPADQQRMAQLVESLRAALGVERLGRLLAEGAALSGEAVLELVDRSRQSLTGPQAARGRRAASSDARRAQSAGGLLTLAPA